MKIWVDADACPGVIKEILYKTAERRQVVVTFVANRHLNMPRSKYIEKLIVPSGFDAADSEIIKRLAKGDLVITSDIPLAADVIGQGGFALNPRGELYSEDTIGSRLNIRDFMDTLRASGIDTGGPAAMGQRERQAFANSLDQLLTKFIQQQPKS